MKLDKLFKLVVEKQASDLFLRAGAVPHIRIHGKLELLDFPAITKEEILRISDFLLASDVRKNIFNEKQDIDFIHQEPEVGRFRINLFFQRGSPALVARYVTDNVLTFEDLNLSAEICRQFCSESRGLVLVCGPAGSGKSTTIASMIQYISANEEKHIVTMEDPIEFLFKDRKSIINQREIGIDVPSYPSALRHVTQQSPDIIYIGTIRDEPTMKAAISAAELGVLVMSTFHTVNAVQTIDRIVNFFPPYLHSEVRMQLSLLLKGVMSMRLIPRKDGKGRIPACETMVVTPTIARLIREGAISQIQSFIEEGELFGMQSFKKSLVKLVKANLVNEADARYLSDSKDEFNLELKGIRRVR